MSRRLRDVRPGDAPSAQKENELRDAVREQMLLRAGAGVNVRKTGDGFSLQATCPERIWIRITSSYSSPGYDWEEIERSAGGWITTGRTGAIASDPAIEQNADTSITSGTRRYPAERDQASGELIFLKV